VAPNDSDRRRFLLASAMTLLALPALWWANKQSDAGAPNVATVGIEVADASDSGANADAAAAIAPIDATGAIPTTTIPVVSTTPTPTTTPPVTEPPPVFLGGPSASGAVARLQVGAWPGRGSAPAPTASGEPRRRRASTADRRGRPGHRARGPA